MIQRIQSVYLFLGAVAAFLAFALDLARFLDVSSIQYVVDAFTFTNSNGDLFTLQQNIPFIILNSLAGGMLLANILLYKNMSLQRKVSRFLHLIILGSVVSMIFMIRTNLNGLDSVDLKLDWYLVGFYMPFVALLFNFMAARAIRRDQELLKSLDRLR